MLPVLFRFFFPRLLALRKDLLVRPPPFSFSHIVCFCPLAHFFLQVGVSQFDCRMQTCVLGCVHIKLLKVLWLFQCRQFLNTIFLSEEKMIRC